MPARTMFSVSETVVAGPPIREAAIYGGARLIAEIDVEVFDLAGQVRREGEFDARAGGPASLRRAAEGQHACGSLEIAERGAARPVEQDAIPGIAGAAAHRGEPIALGCATGEGAAASGVRSVVPFRFAQSPSASTPSTNWPHW